MGCRPRPTQGRPRTPIALISPYRAFRGVRWIGTIAGGSDRHYLVFVCHGSEHLDEAATPTHPTAR